MTGAFMIGILDMLNDIALFVEVAKRKNFSHAAEALNIPSTLSRRVSELAHVGMRCSTAARARST